MQSVAVVAVVVAVRYSYCGMDEGRCDAMRPKLLFQENDWFTSFPSRFRFEVCEASEKRYLFEILCFFGHFSGKVPADLSTIFRMRATVFVS